ncbi:hypothetical protein RchiOBHm_Chr2g0174661 [Rosa chinensis]|uniref:DUF7950 domain-containing protein n=1 Tax=Rosa chinensis TaxID=74649 RepID=A0A2P6S665_ROSCH|nr:uncharacterized protein LOC112186947 isoform X1 [Rosa chinensis]XP_040370227.1 uncharacterized protein LOC112186947 isoform X1 [Rosa chinensis]PRQ54180.1 hypothetical protein RchiOBHm_Chr2g0174661 [Rosa chinensis]
MEGGGEGWRRMISGAEDKYVLNQIMLRFRPIAPKPVTGGSDSGEPPTGRSNALASRGRTKRKYVRVRKNVNGEEESGRERVDSKRVVTLQLLPEIEKSGDYSSDQSTDGGSSCEFDSSIGTNHQWLSLSKIGRENYMRADSAADPAALMDQMGGVESWVTVECVTGTCMKAPPPQGLGIITTDEERMRSLDVDTCPGFVSDGWNRVWWLNGAFRRMVMMAWQQQLPEIAVWLAMNEELPYTHSAFTCQVKLRYTVGNKEKEKYYHSQMVPCDLWRMDGGGFAWRLDVKAALTLAVDAAPLHI